MEECQDFCQIHPAARKSAIMNDRGDAVMKYERVRKGREELGWTQQKMAAVLFVNQKTVSAYENGVNAMSPEILCKLADLFDTSVDFLLNRTDDPKPPARPKRRG